MANKKDVVRMQAFLAFARGCGPTEVDDKACEFFHDRYDPWITKKKQVGTSPEDVWGTEGKNFLAHFKKIGQKAAAAAGGGTIDEATLTTAAQEVEEEAPCPWCPTKPDA